MKIIFLDVDGVLNTQLSAYANLSQNIWDKTTCNLLQNICKYNDDVKIVVSSTWKYRGIACLKSFQDNGFPKIYLHSDWATPCLNIKRGKEIEQWLNQHTDITHYAIIDDDSDMNQEQIEHHFISVDPVNGITFDQYIELCNILKVKDIYGDF